MIPQRMLGNEFSHNGVRNRVTACRKRLRESRVMVKVNAGAEIEELFSEETPSLCRVIEMAANEERELVQPEVGIT